MNREKVARWLIENEYFGPFHGWQYIDEELLEKARKKADQSLSLCDGVGEPVAWAYERKEGDGEWWMANAANGRTTVELWVEERNAWRPGTARIRPLIYGDTSPPTAERIADSGGEKHGEPVAWVSPELLKRLPYGTHEKRELIFPKETKRHTIPLYLHTQPESEQENDDG